METIFSKLEKYSEKIAIFENQSAISYKELLSRAGKIAMRVKHRCVVLICCKNNTSCLAAYIGFIRAGIVPILASNKIDSQLLSKLIVLYKPDYFYIPSESSISFQRYKTVFEEKDYVLKKNVSYASYSINDKLALLLSTSGSTGSPKYVRQSYQNIDSNTNAIVEFLNISKEDRAITTMPMNYTYGLSILNTHLFKGASIILTDDSLINRSFWKTFEENRPTTFGGVPYIFEILKKIKFDKMELPNLRYITQAGGKIDKELFNELCKICVRNKIKFYHMYGQAEATARISYLPWEKVLSKPGSIGIPIPGGKIWLEDEKGRITKNDAQTGELVYEGKNVSMGYAENCFDLQKDDENKGILYTGDLAICDKDGFYYIVGRKKRFLKMFGNRISLDELEQIISSKFKECACSGVDDSIKIFITETKEKSYIKKYISQKTGIHPKGFKIIIVSEIPRNETGKILYSKLESKRIN